MDSGSLASFSFGNEIWLIPAACNWAALRSRGCVTFPKTSDMRNNNASEICKMVTKYQVCFCLVIYELVWGGVRGEWWRGREPKRKMVVIWCCFAAYVRKQEGSKLSSPQTLPFCSSGRIPELRVIVSPELLRFFRLFSPKSSFQ